MFRLKRFVQPVFRWGRRAQRQIERQGVLLVGVRLAKFGPTRALAGKWMERNRYHELAQSNEQSSSSATPSAKRLNRMAEAVGATRYLEIGIQHGLTLESVVVETRIGVDPAHDINTARLPSGVTVITRASDKFFANYRGVGFDLIFLDGLHVFEQTYRDVIHAFRILRPGGLVVIDDTIPSHELAALRTRSLSREAQKELTYPEFEWMGDVFRTVLALSEFHPEIEIATVVDEFHRGQTLAWPASSTARFDMVADDALTKFRFASFSSLFNGGIPAAFNVASLDDAMQRRQAALTSPAGS